MKRIAESKKRKREANIKYKTSIANLKVTTKVNLNELVSDLRYFKPKFWNRMKAKIFPLELVMCVIHYPQNIDVIRYYPMVKPFVININKNLYLFSPKSFRSINGMQKLEFYANVPFAILHDVAGKYHPPTLDSEAFSSVQQSKFIQDAASISEEPSMSGVMIAVIVVSALSFVIGIINLVYLLQISKVLGH
jgi:hypothetical protein